MPVQCPRCELIFVSKSEAKWHLQRDHADETTGVPRRTASPEASGDLTERGAP